MFLEGLLLLCCNGGMDTLSQERASFLATVAERIVPEVGNLDLKGRTRFFQTIDEALRARSPGVRRQFGSLLGVIRWLPLLRWGTSFERLTPERQHRVLSWLMRCPSRTLRQGFWGLRTMVFMGYYGQPETWESIGYVPRVDGNEALHA